MTGSKSKKNSGGRKLTGFIVFSRECRQKHSFERPNLTFGELSRIVGKEWNKLDKKQKKNYQTKAARINRENEKREQKEKSESQAEVVEETDSYEVIDLVDDEEYIPPKSPDVTSSRKSSRAKKNTVVYQASDPGPKPSKAPKSMIPKTVPARIPVMRRNMRSEVDLIMECVEEELSPAQLLAINKARDEHEEANKLIKEFRAGNILVPSSQPNTFIVAQANKPPSQPAPLQPVQYNMVSTPEPVTTGPPPRPAQFLNKQQQLQQKDVTKQPGAPMPDLILVGENRTPVVSQQQQQLLSPIQQQQMLSPLQQQLTTISVPAGTNITPQQMFKYVNVSTVSPTLVQNQWAIRPMLKVPPQQSQSLILSSEPGNVNQVVTLNQLQQQSLVPSKSNTQASGQKRPSSSDTPLGPPAKKKNVKTGDPVGDNWIPLDEYYYGTHDGDAGYTEEKGEYRFKCWYCSKMLYNNVRAMQHIQGHIDASKQQNIDLSDLTQCKHCYKQFDTPFEMQTHVEKVHLSNKVLMCRICEKDFPSQGDLVSHMKTQHRVCEMPYVCQLCQFRSSMYSDVVDHFKKKHDSSNHLLCLYCLRAFEVKFVSQGWGQTQTYYGHLLKHQTKSATKKCGLCRLMFFNSIDVKTHRKTCHNSNPMNIQGYSPGGKSDLGTSQKKGSSLKSLNAPSVSRIQDYGEISFPASTKHLNCVECKMLMSSTDHYKKYIHCTMCRFATSCSVAYANHMMGFHSGQMSSLNLNIPWERPIKNMMYCACGFSSKYGNKIANHLVQCGKWTSFWKKPVTVAGVSTIKKKLDENKDEGSLLDMLGLVQKKTVVPTLNIPGEIHNLSKKKAENVEDVKKQDTKSVGDEKDTTSDTKENKSDKDDAGTSIVDDLTKEPAITDDQHVDKSNDESKDSTDDKDNMATDEVVDNVDDKTKTDDDKYIPDDGEKSEDTPGSSNKDEDLTNTAENKVRQEESTDVEEKGETETKIKSKEFDDVLEESMGEEKKMDQGMGDKVSEDKDTDKESENIEENAGSVEDGEEKDDDIEDEMKELDDNEKLDDGEAKVSEEEKITELFDDTTNDNAGDDDVMETDDGNKEEVSKDDKTTTESDVDIDNGGSKMDDMDETGEVSTEDSLNLTSDTLETVDEADDDNKYVGEDIADEKDEEAVKDTTGETKEEKKSEQKSTAEDTSKTTALDVDERSTTGDADDTVKYQTKQDTTSKSTESNTSRGSTDHRHGNQDNKSSSQGTSSSYRSESASRSHGSSRDRSHDSNRDRSHDSKDRSHDSRDRSHDSRDRSHERDRSYDRDRNRDRDRGDWNRDRNRDHTRQHDHRSGGGSGYGHQDNRDRGYRGGHQGHRDGYRGNRDHQNRGGHHQDRNFNRNYNNRGGGYNQNYRGGYRGGYY